MALSIWQRLRDALSMRLRAAGLLLVLISLIASSAFAALAPEEYDRARQMAPLAFTAVVQQDPGGMARVRVEHVARGMLQIGQIVAVVYPEDRGPAPPGPQVFYRRFPAGSRLRVFGQGGAPTIHIVHGGIDVLYAPAPQRGGCASCAIGEPPRGKPRGVALIAAMAIAMIWRRSSRRTRTGR